MIQFEEVVKQYPNSGLPAVDAVTFTIGAGENWALLGTSGSGKTTLLKMINRLVLPTGGRVSVNHPDLPADDLITLRRRMGYVIQDGGLFPHMSVAENISLVAKLSGWNPDKMQSRTAELLRLVNLDDELADRFPDELSGGQRQRVGVARALMLDPPLILLDEPFGALDPITRRELQLEFKNLQKSVGKTTVLVTHDVEEAFLLCDHIALLDAGKLIQAGPADNLKENPANEFVRSFLALEPLAAS